jgi:hypothetical protein
MTDHRRPASTDDASTAPTTDAIRLGRRSFRLVQRCTSHIPSGDPRIAPNDKTRPKRNTTTPAMPLKIRRMSGMGVEETGVLGGPTGME